MGTRGTLLLLAAATLVLVPAWGALALTLPAPGLVQADNPNPPASPVKLIFIHHSSGENWLSDGDGALGVALRDNNYFVSDTNYGWGPDGIGDLTDIGHWWNWFRGPNHSTYLQALYTEFGDHSYNYSRRSDPDPARENQIVVLKSCFPNSHLGGSPSDPPTTGANPLRGQDAWSEHMTMANAKGIYNDILTYFATRPDKLFVVITAPPLARGDTDAAHAANARAFNDWLYNDWLDGYAHDNVAVWDFYNVLTSSGGNPSTSDEGWEAGNHHRWWRGAEQHIQIVPHDFSAYPTAPDDSHPTAAGNRKATAELVPMLNAFYHRWMGAAPTPAVTATRTRTPVATPTRTSRPTLSPTPRQTLPLTPSQTQRLYLPLILKGYTPRPPPTATPPSPASLDVHLRVSNTLRYDRHDEPVTSGLPIPRSANLTDLSALRLLDEGNRPVPAQFTPLARWGGAPDDASKPVRWLLLDFAARVRSKATATYRLLDSGGPGPTMPTLTVTDGADAVTVHTGAAEFRIDKTGGNLWGPHLSAPLSGRATDAEGREYRTRGPVSVEVALSGPMRVSIHVKGAYRDAAGTPLVDYTSRYWFYAGQAEVRLFHTVENNRLCPLVEYEQLDCYDIGSRGSVTVDDLSLLLEAGPGGSLLYWAAGQGTTAHGVLTEPLLLYQDSSGNDPWDLYASFTDWYGDPLDARPRLQSYASFRGYRTTLGAQVVDQGDHAEGWLTLLGRGGMWGVGVRGFWQNSPKALRASPDGAMEIGLFPGEFGPAGYGFNLRAGEHKTHEVWLSTSIVIALPTVAAPLFAAATPEWYVHSGAVPFLAPLQLSDWPDHEYYVRNQLYTAPTYDDWMDWFPNLLAAVEGTDFYGIFDYGDVPLDYEGYLVSPMNPKYHMDLGMWMQWARSGEPSWFGLAEAAGRHIADIDILHNVHSPRHWGDGIMFGHSSHDEPGFLNPHRNFQGTHPDTAFGAPGLLATYYWTGYEKALESALELAACIEYRLHNDGHLCPFFPDGECSGEGYALDGGMYAAGCRPAANNLSIAVAAYRATADPRYLAVADALVQWARAEDQPYINGPTGQDEHMRPWMLNMYLRALADYLDTRAEFGLPDTYDARGSYLAYADWLRSYAWIDLPPADSGARGAYPYAWWFDGRTGIPGEDNDNGDPSINNWLLVGADALAYAYRLSGDGDYLQRAAQLFRTGSRDPWYEGDLNTYSATKEAANSLAWGHVFLHEWAGRP